MKAKTHLSQNKSRGGFTLVEMLVVIGMIAALAGISFPVYNSIQKKVEKQQVQMMWSSLERAVDNFETEYNYLPYIGAAYPASEPPYTKDQTEAFTTVLAGGYTVSNTANFKGIQFFEWADPKGDDSSNYKNGLLVTGTGTAKTATLYTPWGGEYSHFTLDYDMDGLAWVPYGGGAYAPMIKKVFFLDEGADGSFSSPSGLTDEFCSCRRCVVCDHINLW